MRLLHRTNDGKLGLTRRYFHEDETPQYAILSHTWLAESEEVDFVDLCNGNTTGKVASWRKINFCAERAAKDGLLYFWIDTCCIDRSSSQELGESIVHMFRWYQHATRCYAYLSDISVTDGEIDPEGISRPWELDFRSSRWFTRGWTLQELIAPSHVEFFSVEGTRLGDKLSLESVIHEITCIPLEVFRGADVASYSTNERFRWSEHRDTTRTEDKAYCLLGIFGTYMPLYYGEGGDAALKRLREAMELEESKSYQRISLLPVARQAAFNSIDNQHKSTCLADTRVEVLQNITDWVDGNQSSSIYWLSGGAGTGKSTVARTIARMYHDRGTLAGSFFFSKTGGNVCRADMLFTTLAAQISTRVPAAAPHISESVKKNPDIATHSLRDQWEQLILQPLFKLSGPAKLVIVIDALDECESEKDIRILIRLLAMNSALINLQLRVFLTSRPGIPVRTGFSQIPEVQRQSFILEEISPTSVDRDLRLFFEHTLTEIRDELGFAPDWPGLKIIKRLVTISCGLFIWASTACRFIRKGRRFARKRISMLIHQHGAGTDPEKQLDEIYLTVLRDSIAEDYQEDEKQAWYEILRQVVGSIAILCEPMSRVSLAALLDLPSEDVEETLADLHTVLKIPSMKARPVLLHHPTFRDFITNKRRCSDPNFWVDERKTHLHVATKCIEVMSRLFKTDICSLGSPGVENKDVTAERVNAAIPDELRYACCYWVQHYRLSGTRLRDGDLPHVFFQRHFLCWLEVMSLIGKMPEVAQTLRMYSSLIIPDESVQQIPLVHDARRFFFAFQPVIERAPLQVYCTALAFSPRYNEIRQRFWPETTRWFRHYRRAEASNLTSSKRTKATFFVNHITFTPDGKELVSGSTEPEIRLWNMASKSPTRKFVREGRKSNPYALRYDRLRTDGMKGVAISKDQRRLASGSDDGLVTIWDFDTGIVQHVMSTHTSWVNCVAFSQDGRLLASGSMDETVRIWDIQNGQELYILKDDLSCVNDVAFAPDGTSLASASVDKLIRLWDIRRAEVRLLLDGHSGAVNAVRFSADGRLLASVSDDRSVRLWDGKTGADLRTFRGHQRRALSVDLSPNGRFVASGSEDMDIKIWDIDSGLLLHSMGGHLSGVNALAFSPDGKWLASSSFDVSLKLWSVRTGEARGGFVEYEEDPQSESDISGQQSLSDDDLDNSAAQVQTGHSGVVVCIAFSPDGNLVATGSYDSTIKVWNMQNQQCLPLVGHSASVNSVEFSPDGHLIASASSDNTVQMWNAATGSSWHTMHGHTGDVLIARFSPNGEYLASCSIDKSVILWHTGTGALCAKLEGHLDTVNAVAFSADTHQLLASCSSDTTIRLWHTGTGSCMGCFRGHTDSVEGIAFSADGRLLSSASSDRTVKLWDLSGTLLLTLLGHTAPVRGVSLSSGGHSLVSCATDGTVILWDLGSAEQVANLDCDSVLEAITFSSDEQYINTNRGTLQITRSNSDLVATQLNFRLFITKDRILIDGKVVLELPNEYRATVIGIHQQSLILGHSDGTVSFFQL